MDIENCKKVYDQIKERWILLHGTLASDSFFWDLK